MSARRRRMSTSVNMAAEEILNNDLNEYEKVVNRWTVDYYIVLALEFFKNQNYTDFCAYKNIINRILDRPVEKADILPLKIRIFEFLSHISDAEKLDQSFECGQNKTPLEKALPLLESMTKEFSLPPPDCENVCTSLKEMIVGTFIKNGQFEKAKEALNQYFSMSMTGKRTTFMSLIRQKKKTHEVIEQINFQSFKTEMLDFCQRLFSFSPPFLLKAAKGLVQNRLEIDDTTSGPGEQGQPSSSCCTQVHTVQLQISEPLSIQKIRLKMAYRALAEQSCEVTFDQLEHEVDTEAREHAIKLQLSPDPTKGTNLDSEQVLLIQRDSCSPMEASPAEQPPQPDTGAQTQAGSLSSYTVPRLLAEPDSQLSSQCTTAAEETEAEAGTQQPPQTVSGRNDQDMPNPVPNKEVSTPRRVTRASSAALLKRTSRSLAGCSAESDENLLDSAVNNEDLHDRSNQSFSRKSNKSKDSSSEIKGKPQKQSTPCRTPRQRPPEPPSPPLSKNVNPGDIEDCSISDFSLNSSPAESSRPPVSQKSSPPDKVTRPFLKWKEALRTATETKDTWSDEESEYNFPKNAIFNTSTSSISGTRKRMWTESETQKLKDGVKRFGEGNWSKIQAYYKFNNRTNVNLKDRWRTMKNSKLV